MGKRNLIAGLLGITLVCALIFTGCELEGATPETVDAATPVFSVEPVSKEDVPGWVDLRAQASVTDGGTLSYQWFALEETYDDPAGTVASDDDPDNSNYSLELTEGIYQFYVVVTNTNTRVNGKQTATLKSNIITIFVVDPYDPVKYPLIKQHPADTTSIAGDITLSVEATGQEGGVLSYQWYSSDTLSNNSGTTVQSATEAECTINLTAGTYYFYAVVTNSVTTPGVDESGESIETVVSKSVTSHPATVEVIAEMTPNATIILTTGRKYQYVRGFGGMDIPWDNFWSITEEEYEKMYNPDTGLGYNMMRIMIMPENPEDNTDPVKTLDYYLGGTEMGGGARPNYIKGAQIVNKYNGYLLASPWSPPPEWKSNNSKNGGGHLEPTYYVRYANYLKTYAQEMYNRGAPIYAISIQNEPNFTASYDGCEWTNDQMRDFFKTTGVGRFTEGVKGWGNGVEIPRVLIMNGESANHPNINDSALDDPVSRDIIDVIGRHTYGDVNIRYAKAINFGKEVWMTEHNINSGNEIAYPNDSTWNYVWQFMNDVDVSIRLNDESAFIWWALKRFYSFIGDGAANGGTVEGVILPRGYALSHYAKFAKETWRIGLSAQRGSTTADGETALDESNFNNTVFDRDSVAAKATAFVSEDGNEISLVLWTPTDTSGRNGVDMGTVKIQLPQGFTASAATAMRSTAAVKAKKEDVLMSADRNSAFIMLPPGNIVSVRFTK